MSECVAILPIERTITPSSATELAEAVRAYRDAAIYPIGTGSWQDLGYPPTRPGVGLSTLGLNRVVDYPHEELTITVEAGILISELAEILAAKGQMLPFDCPHPERATLGGLLATNTSGPRRLAYGTARDSVLGLDVIDASGTRIHGGGRVVKNVAGYDLPKMHIGGLGTLGIIAEATIKVRPTPEGVAWIDFNLPRDRLNQFLAAFQASGLRPVAMEIGHLRPTQPNHYQIMMLFEDTAEAVANQAEAATSLARNFHPGVFTNEGTDARLVLRRATDDMSDAPGNIGAKISVLPSRVPTLLATLPRSVPNASLQAHAVVGVLRVYWDAASLETAREQVRGIQSLVGRLGGRFSLPRCPDEWKRQLPIWGALGPEVEWMRRLRGALDPQRMLNPGRFVVE